MKSSHLKTALLCWLRFERGFQYIATECGSFMADVVGADCRQLVEIEVKVNLSDLRNDAKKPKHQHYVKHAGSSDWTGLWIPNRFFFAVTEELADAAIKLVETLNPAYGVLVISEDRCRGVECRRRSKYLHKRAPVETELTGVAKRMSSELCSWYLYDAEEETARFIAMKAMRELVEISEATDRFDSTDFNETQTEQEIA